MNDSWAACGWIICRWCAATYKRIANRDGPGSANSRSRSEAIAVRTGYSDRLACLCDESQTRSPPSYKRIHHPAMVRKLPALADRKRVRVDDRRLMKPIPDYFGRSQISTQKDSHTLHAPKIPTDRPLAGSVCWVKGTCSEQELQRELKEPRIRCICLERDRSSDCARGGRNPS
jgi:hypothetical protein